MPLCKMRVLRYRAFEDSGEIPIGGTTAIVGPNDVGKSVLLRALALFFSPPSRGGLAAEDLHGMDTAQTARIEVAFDPGRLETTLVNLDAKNSIDLVEDHLIDDCGTLHLAVEISTNRVESFEILLEDVDDNSFPLALKSQDELLELLKQRGLEAKKSGKETNKERRDKLRQAAVDEGSGRKSGWVDASSIEKQLRAILPEFVYFTDSSDYSISTTQVQNHFKGVVDRALSGNPEARKFEQDIRATIQIEFDKVYSHMSRLTDTVSAIQAVPQVSWKKAVDGIGLFWTDVAGLNVPFASRGAGVRRLFMVAYLQYQAAEGILEPTGKRYVFAIEEPEVHLHPGAQRELDAALRDLSSLGHAVVLTTHSPVIAAGASVEDLVLVRRHGPSSTAITFPGVDYMQIASDLGLEASDRLVGKNYVILVEGPSDAEFYSTALGQLNKAGLVNLDPDLVMFLQCGGIGNLKFMVTSRCLDDAGLTWAVLADSDRQVAGGPPAGVVKGLKSILPATCKGLKVLQRTCVENYLDAGAVKTVTGIDCQIPQYGRLLAAGGNPLGKSALNIVKRNAGSIAAVMGAQGLVSTSLDGSGGSELVSIYQGIYADFGL